MVILIVAFLCVPISNAVSLEVLQDYLHALNHGANRPATGWVLKEQPVANSFFSSAVTILAFGTKSTQISAQVGDTVAYAYNRWRDTHRVRFDMSSKTTIILSRMQKSENGCKGFMSSVGIPLEAGTAVIVGTPWVPETRFGHKLIEITLKSVEGAQAVFSIRAIRTPE